MAEKMSSMEERRLWIGNLDTRMTEFQLLKILQKCGSIEKFDMLFHKSGPQIGQPRGYAFVTYEHVKSANTALTKLHGKHIGNKMVVVRLAKNLNYDDLEKPKPKISIPALEAGSSGSTKEPMKFSKAITIQAIEAKLKMLESNADDFEINKSRADEVPLIHKYQYNKNSLTDLKSNTNKSTKYNTKTRYNNSHHKRHKR